LANPPAAQVVGTAIQNLMAARLGRAFLSVAAVGLVGLGRALLETPPVGDAWALAAGALATAAAMLAYGQRVVQRALGRTARPWMGAALVGSLVPPVYGVYVVGWHGLRGIAEGGGGGAGLHAILLTGAGVWVLRSWMRIVEIERLAGVMAMDTHTHEEGSA
jgi:hypothetical protein